MKTIANRLKSIMPKIVRPKQSSFVPGRHITDNIVIAQECFQSMQGKKGRVGYMVIKVDLEKAYDRISWEFLFDTLQEVGLPNTLSRTIMDCVTSSSM